MSADKLSQEKIKTMTESSNKEEKQINQEGKRDFKW